MNILELIEKHGHGFGISDNPSVTPELIEKHIDRPWEWSAHGLSIISFSASEARNKAARNKAARIIQIKFLDWFYKPLCKDGTYGLNCLLAQRLCT
jgi:hypothetical protein